MDNKQRCHFYVHACINVHSRNHGGLEFYHFICHINNVLEICLGKTTTVKSDGQKNNMALFEVLLRSKHDCFMFSSLASENDKRLAV